MPEMPADNTVEFPLPTLATFDGSPAHVGECVSVQPLFAEHREESGEERNGEAGIQHGLNLDDRAWRTRPLRDGRNSVKSGVVHHVDDDAEESGGFFTWILLELGVDLDNEGGSDSGEQTSL